MGVCTHPSWQHLYTRTLLQQLQHQMLPTSTEPALHWPDTAVFKLPVLHQCTPRARKPQCLSAAVNATPSPSTFLLESTVHLQSVKPGSATDSSSDLRSMCQKLIQHTWLGTPCFYFYFTSSQQLKAALLAALKVACQHSRKKGRKKRKSQ